ncbi:TPR repeat-containing protein [Fontimonas thermophila]|uniref:TPR repeat-containing protein n=2 Tax=Fontimonas thermophila TaxID=1076937 RepID=A0A1I2JWB4_9GAMM|nr:TPR repeat-containing protein [Fontimonas thermophila]
MLRALTITASALLVVGLLTAIPAGNAQAQESAAAQAAPKKKERKASGTLSEGTYRQLERIHDLIGKNKNAEALEKSQALLERVGNDYERAVVRQTMAFIYVSQNNYKAAIAAFEEALKLDALPQQPYEQMLYNVAQLYFQDGQTDRAIQSMERYFAEATTEPPADAHILLASAYADRKRFADALPQVDKALAKVKEPKESWLQLKLALHYELKQFPQCAEVLLRLVSLVPAKEDYWKQLSSILFEIQKDRESLAVLALADRQGFLDTEGELRNLANIYLLLNIPYKAAQILERGLEQKILKADEKTLQLLGDAWTMAREYDKAEAALKRAAAISDSGEIYYRLGQIYIEDERWKDALEVLPKAQAKGIKKMGDAAYLEGVAAFQAGNRKRAVEALRKAQGYDESRNNATQWLNHIAQIEEAEAQAAIAAAEAKADKAEGGSAKN